MEIQYDSSLGREERKTGGERVKKGGNKFITATQFPIWSESWSENDLGGVFSEFMIKNPENNKKSKPLNLL